MQPTVKVKVSAGKHGAFEVDIPESHAVEKLRLAWEEYILHRNHIRKPMSLPCARRRFYRLCAMSLREALTWLDFNMEQNYEGFFEPKPDWSPVGGDDDAKPVRWGVDQ